MSPIPTEQVAFFYRKMASMVSAGIQLDRAVGAQTGSGNKTLDDVVDGLHTKICTGWSLSRAMAEHPEVFDPVCVGLVRAGEESGNIAPILEKLAELQERSVRLKKMVISALTYPGILLLTILGLGVLFVTFVCPEDGGLFQAMGGEMPWPSAVLMSISKVVRNPLFFLGLPALLASQVYLVSSHAKKYPQFKLQIDQFLLDLPILGNVITKNIVARVVYILGSSLQMGLTLVAALNLAERVAGNQAIAKKLELARTTLTEEGEGLAKSLSRHLALPALVTALIESGEATGRLDELLTRASSQLEEDVQETTLAAARLLEPILMIGAGLAAGLVALASLMPMIELVNHL